MQEKISKESIKSSVEGIIRLSDKVLITKRSNHCDVAPGIWNVPAGKVKFGESTADAVIREILEETGIKTKIVFLVSQITCTLKKGQNIENRNIYTYYLIPESIESMTKVILNNEHSAYAWITAEDLNDPKYGSIRSHLVESIKKILSLT